MDMAGNVFVRRAGAALLAGLFFAVVPARGQTVATDQTQKTYSNGQTLAAVVAAENPGAEAPYPGMALRGPEGARFHLFGASPLSSDDLGDAELPDAPVPSDAELPDAPAPRAVEPARPSKIQSEPYTPITPHERLVWVVKTTLSPQSLMFGAIRTGITTGLDEPPEDGPHWGGFAERFGIRLTGVATSKMMEASVGSLWGEDPRYFRVPEEPFGARVKHVIKMTFFARRADGKIAPAYARYIAFSGSNFLSNEWRPNSEANTDDAVRRTLEAFAGHMAGNAWDEFWPDAKRCIFHHCKQP